MPVPIILNAFGTTSRARHTYDLLQRKIQEAFAGHTIYWTLSSRTVKQRLEEKKGPVVKDLHHTHELFPILARQGVKKAIVQSLHLINGHEFYRLTREVEDAGLSTGIRTAMGLPLLDSPQDFQTVAQTLSCQQREEGQALIFIGHGTDHAAWSAYLALEHFLQIKGGQNCYLGVIEGYPGKEDIVTRLLVDQVKKVCLIPFMLISGIHFKEDIIGAEESWKTYLEKAGFKVTWKADSLGNNPGIINIFIKHIRDALSASEF